MALVEKFAVIAGALSENRLFGGYMAERTLLLIVACFLAPCSIAAEPIGSGVPIASQAEKEILGLCQAWDTAENSKDAKTLRRILDDRFVATIGSGKTIHKEAYIRAAIGDGTVDASASQTLADETVVVNRDTAVIVGINTGTGTDKGHSYRRAAKFTITWIWRGGRWLALAEHIVRMPSSAR